MPAHVEKLSFNYNSQFLDPLWVILDSELSPPILPLLFSTHLSTHGVVFEARELADDTRLKRTYSLVEREVSDSTIRSYIYCLSQFLNYLEQCKKEHKTPGLHASSAVNDRFINHYINQVLANSLGSIQSLNSHRSALVAYYNWLDYMEICPRLRIRIYRKTKQEMAERCSKQQYIQYVSRHSRASLLISCETLAEKLIMRMGFEVGLRTSELMGLRVSGESNLTELFDQINNKDYDDVERFSYWLHGRYTKGNRSRWIYFSRLLLEDMQRYFNTERQWLIDQTGSKDPSFFLRTDSNFVGVGIGQEQASRVFNKRCKSAGLNPLLKFHDLRHTFATELFHSELAGQDGRETRSESAALIVVAQRLGHAFTIDGNAPPTTTRYIRMSIQMLEMEQVQHG